MLHANSLAGALMFTLTLVTLVGLLACWRHLLKQCQIVINFNYEKLSIKACTQSYRKLTRTMPALVTIGGSVDVLYI